MLTGDYQLHKHNTQLTSFIAIIGLCLFFSLLLLSLLISPIKPNKLFFDKHGRHHRLLGALNLLWLVIGISNFIVYQPIKYIATSDHSDDIDSINQKNINSYAIQCLTYDIILGILGILSTLTAAINFPHKYITNKPGESGTLSNYAIVTQSEMVEHSYYQIVNLCQAVYLHMITYWVVSDVSSSRLILLLLVTLPWAVRRKFPVNSFSANWTTKQQQSDTISKEKFKVFKRSSNNHINNMYRIKKWQYVFYKHVILHGLNISIAFPREGISSLTNIDNIDLPLPLTTEWRIFWIALNTSYVMEFFLNSLVKRDILSQQYMMILNGLLMCSASLAAVCVVNSVRLEAAMLSLLFNFGNRGHDVINTLVVGCIVSYI